MDALDVISQTLHGLGPRHPERVYQNAVGQALNAAGLCWGRPNLPGLGNPDFFIEGTTPLLVELKASGDWRDVACGLAQLRIYGSDESMEKKKVRKVLALPEKPMHPECFREMATLLGVEILAV